MEEINSAFEVFLELARFVSARLGDIELSNRVSVFSIYQEAADSYTSGTLVPLLSDSLLKFMY